MPLLALTAVVFNGSFERKEIRLLVTALLFGCVGDIFLLSDDFLLFVSGMVAFLVGHIFYMVLFGGKSWKGLTLKTWIPTLLVMAVLVAILIKVIGVSGALLVPIIVYGMALMMIIFFGLAGVVRFKTGTWWLILCGTVLFTFSDSMIAVGKFVGEFPGRGFIVMLTYITAQSLLATGAIRLTKEN